MKITPSPARIWILALTLPVLLLSACHSDSPEPAATEGETSAPATAEKTAATYAQEPDPCPDPAPCDPDCSNQPYVPTECWTTPYGPAKADIVLGDALTSTSMLYCEGGSYALCFFSGPSEATGTNPNNPPLPCVLEGDTANCTCQVYTSGPYYVAITSILNEGAYYETVKTCGADGSGCANMATCGPKSQPGDCDGQTIAPVCTYVAAQDPDNDAVSLIPGADLISTFSFAMDADYQLGATPCEGLYAGCMTAPCYFAEGATLPPADGDPIQCQCPLYNDTYQIGQPLQGKNCPIPDAGDGHRYTWSASNTVPITTE